MVAIILSLCAPAAVFAEEAALATANNADEDKQTIKAQFPGLRLELTLDIALAKLFPAER